MILQWKYRSIKIHHFPSILFALLWFTLTYCLHCYNWVSQLLFHAPPDQHHVRTTQWWFVFKLDLVTSLAPPPSLSLPHYQLILYLNPHHHHQYSAKYLQWSIKPEEGTENSLVSAGCTQCLCGGKVVSRVCDDICSEINRDKSWPHFWKISLRCCRLFLVFISWCIIWNLADLQAQKPGNEFNSSLGRWW